MRMVLKVLVLFCLFIASVQASWVLKLVNESERLTEDAQLFMGPIVQMYSVDKKEPTAVTFEQDASGTLTILWRAFGPGKMVSCSLNKHMDKHQVTATLRHNKCQITEQ